MLSQVPSTSMRVAAYIVYWDQQRGFASAEQNITDLSDVSPWWYSLNSSGEVVPQDSSVTHIDQSAVRSLRARGVSVIPTISNHRDGSWDTAVAGSVLRDPDRARAHIRNIVDLVVSQGYDGIDIDYEDLTSIDRYAFSAFVRELSNSLRARGKTLAVDLFPQTAHAIESERSAAQDYVAIGAAADHVRVMAYDFHWSTSVPGPMAPSKWVEDVIEWTITQIPTEKIAIGLPLFGYDWVNGQGEPVTWQDAQDRARKYKSAIHYDQWSDAPWFTYTDDGGRPHTVWFEDARSIATKLKLLRAHGISQVFLWRLGGEDPEVWPLLRGEQLP